MATKAANDKIYLESDVPDRKLLMIETAVRSGLAMSRKQLHVHAAARIRFWALPRIRDGLLCKGSAEKRFMNIGITKKHLQEKSAARSLTHMVVHEYVHVLRLRMKRHRAVRILEAVVEEGIALAIETALCGPPRLLDIKTLNEKTVRQCWSVFAHVADRPLSRFPKISRNLAFRAAHYRLGYAIIRRYRKEHHVKDLAKLIRTPNRILVRFAQRIYGGMV